MLTYDISHFYKTIKGGFEYEQNPDQVARFDGIIHNIVPNHKVVFPTFKPHIPNTVATLFASPSQKAWKYECSMSKIDKSNGMDKTFNDIRLRLNKISDKSFENMQSEIFAIIDELGDDITPESISKLSTSVFETASQNIFYSKLYAKLYANLINKYPMLNEIFQDNYNSYMNLFDNVRHVDPDKDYDLYCEINKENRKRRAISSFFVNLVPYEIISKDSITTILIEMIGKFTVASNTEHMVDEVNEYVENIAILYNKDLVNGNMCVVIESDAIPLTEYMTAMSMVKIADFKSLSNKALFKLRDIV